MENRATKKQGYRIALILLLIGILSFGYFLGQHSQEKENKVSIDKQIQSLRIGEKDYRVEVANTEEARQRGLGGRESICEHCGMLFLFDAPGKYGFWMKDMRFALDILWVRNGRVVYKEEAVSFEDQQKTFTPTVEADSVIEVLPHSGIAVGDRVVLQK